MSELDAKQVLAMILLGVFLIVLVRYLMTYLKEKRFSTIADIVSSSDFDNLTDSQKEIFIEHINLKDEQLKYDSDVYKLQMRVYGSISLFFIVSALVIAIRIFLAALSNFNNSLPLIGAIEQIPLAFIWFFGAVVFSVLRANAVKNLDIAIMLEKSSLKID